MKVLLIQAGMPEIRRPYDVVEGGQIMMPIGLAYLGAVAKEKGAEVRVKDYLARKFDAEDLGEEVNNFKPDLVGISSYTATYNQALRIAHHLKKIAPVPLLMGGLHVSYLPEEALKNDFLDFVIRGEGEKTLAEFIDFLEGKRDISLIKGLSFKNKGRIVHNAEREEIGDLDSLPYPDWSIFKQEFYRSPLTGETCIPINFGRGCPYSCSFCSVGGRKRRERKAEAVVREFKWMLEKFGFKNFMVTDDVHLPLGEFRKIIEFLKEEDLGISWKMTNRLDRVDRDLLIEMRKAGCQAIGYGLESPSASTLKNIHKNISLSDALKVIGWTQDAGISVAASFMFGFPWESREDIKETIKFSSTLPLYSICYNLVACFPGTEMFNQLLGEGKINLNELNWDDFTIHKAVFPTRYLSKNELDRYLEFAYDYFYFRKIREDICKILKKPDIFFKKGKFNYHGLKRQFPSISKATSFYYGEILKQKRMLEKIKYLARIGRYLLIPPGL